MSDRMPNYYVEQHRLKSEILDQQSTISKQYLQIFEMVDRKQRLVENIAAAQAAIIDKETRLKSLEDQHGALSESEFIKMVGDV